MPKGWFGPKRIGWGASPRSWQGWVATIISIVLMIATVFIAPRLASIFEVQRVRAIIGVAIVVEIAAFLLVVWATYDPNAR